MINISPETYLMCKYYVAGILTCAILGPYCADLTHMYLNGNLDTFRACMVGNLFIPMLSIIVIILAILIMLCRGWKQTLPNIDNAEYRSFSSR